MSEQQRVVVGVDGSADSTAALEWAEHFAGQTGAPLLLVTTWEQPVEYGVPAPWPAGYRPDKTARAVVEKARAHLGNTPVPVEITVREGRAGRRSRSWPACGVPRPVPLSTGLSRLVPSMAGQSSPRRSCLPAGQRPAADATH